MSASSPLRRDHPLMKAWTSYARSFNFENSFRWAADPEHRRGIFWAAFLAGWQAAHGLTGDDPVPDDAALSQQQEAAWRPIEEAPRDGTRFWGLIDEDAIAMCWHEGFGEFVSSWSRMTMAPGYLIDGKPHQDHHPVIHRPTHFMPIRLPAPPAEGGK